MMNMFPERMQSLLFSDAAPWNVYDALNASNPTEKQKRILKYQEFLKLIDVEESNSHHDEEQEDPDNALSYYEKNELFLEDNYHPFDVDYVPRNIDKLLNLKFLYIIHQTISTLPGNIHTMRNLQYLHIRKTNIRRFPVPTGGQEHIFKRLKMLSIEHDMELTQEEIVIIRERSANGSLEVVFVDDDGDRVKNPYRYIPVALASLVTPRVVDVETVSPGRDDSPRVMALPVGEEEETRGGKKKTKTKTKTRGGKGNKRKTKTKKGYKRR